jgi:hypothetical protein
MRYGSDRLDGIASDSSALLQMFENSHRKRRSRTTSRRHEQEPSEKRNGDTPIGYSGLASLRRGQCNGFDQRVARQQLCKHGTTRNSI